MEGKSLSVKKIISKKGLIMLVIFNNQGHNITLWAENNNLFENATNMILKDKKLQRQLSVIVFAGAISGCTMPGSLQMATWALDGISFLATDKSLTDHGISFVVQKDCALWRGFKGEEICSDFDGNESIAVAAANTDEIDDYMNSIDALGQENSFAIGKKAIIVKDKVDEPDPEISLLKVQHDLKKDIENDRGHGAIKARKFQNLNTYIIIGSFSNPDNAYRLKIKHIALNPIVLASHLDGGDIYRVAVGPLSGHQKIDASKKLKKLGIKNAWEMRLNQSKWRLAKTQKNNNVLKINEMNSKVAEPSIVDKQSLEKNNIVKDSVRAVGKPKNQVTYSQRHLVIGSFSNSKNALKFAKTKRSLSPRLMLVETSNGWRHRVIIGPYERSERNIVRRKLEKLGIEKIWALNLNKNDIISDFMLAETEKKEEISHNQTTQKPNTEISNNEPVWGADMVKDIVNIFRISAIKNLIGLPISLKG